MRLFSLLINLYLIFFNPFRITSEHDCSYNYLILSFFFHQKKSVNAKIEKWLILLLSLNQCLHLLVLLFSSDYVKVIMSYIGTTVFDVWGNFVSILIYTHIPKINFLSTYAFEFLLPTDFYVFTFIFLNDIPSFRFSTYILKYIFKKGSAYRN